MNVDTLIQTSLFLLTLESYPYIHDAYNIINYSEKMAISISKIAIVPKLKRDEAKSYDDAIKIINYHRLSQHIVLIPVGLFYT